MKQHAHTHEWHDYYKDHKKITPSNIALHWQYLFDIIADRPKKLLEIGCGPADQSIFLKKIFPFLKISLLDSDRNLIKILKKRFDSKIASFHICDITKKTDVKSQKFKENEFDVIYSQGLLEHLSEKQLIGTVNNFLPYTKKMVMSIPAETYPSHDFGDEILRNEKELRKILKKIKGISYDVKRYFPDIGVRTKAIVIKNKKYNLFNALAFLLFGGCHYIVEIRKK